MGTLFTQEAAVELQLLQPPLVNLVVNYLRETEESILEIGQKAFFEKRGQMLPSTFNIYTEDGPWITSVCPYPKKASLQQTINFLKSKRHRWLLVDGVRVLDCDMFDLVTVGTQVAFFMHKRAILFPQK